MITRKKRHQQVTELNISNVLMPRSSLKASKVVILNSAHNPIMNIPNRSDFQQMTDNHLDNDINNFK